VYPSLYEGFGLPALEALAIGRPVVTSEKGSLKEVVSDAAIFTQPQSVLSIKSSILKALTQDNKDLITKGLKQASKFTWEKTAKQTINVYKSIL
jgi:glycosyltransferase involved in cell wall biosynthesis